jgi:hypothetical protein
MVKNSGGNKAKSFARKTFQSNDSNLRFIQGPDERYAVVQKIFGGSICQVLTHDDILCKAVIRGKFRGKAKRSNLISIGSFVIVSIRDWATDSLSDIEHVFSPQHLALFKLLPNFPANLLPNDSTPDAFLFSSLDNNTTTTTTTTTDSIHLSSHNLLDSNSDFDFNDI